MPWILYDPDDDTYLSQEMHGKGEDDDLSDGLWQREEKYATEFDTEQEALKVIEEIDVEDILLQIVPMWRSIPRAEQGKKRWEDMTILERMQQIEEDAEVTAAERVQRMMLKSRRMRKPIDPVNLRVAPPVMTTGRLTSSVPELQHLRRPRPIDPIYFPLIQGSASDMVACAGVQKALKEMCKGMPLVLMAKAPPELTAEERERQKALEIDNIAYSDRVDDHVNGLALAFDYADLELRTLAVLKERTNGREEEGFRLLYGMFGDGGEARPELPGDEGVPGGGGGDRGGGG